MALNMHIWEHIIILDRILIVPEPFHPTRHVDRIASTGFYLKLKFTDIPTSVSAISVDNDRCIINSDNDINLYPYFNFKFFRLVKGLNQLKVSGKGTLRIVCEFPINVGG